MIRPPAASLLALVLLAGACRTPKGPSTPEPEPAAPAPPASAPAAAAADAGIAGEADSDHLPGRTDIRLCRKDWSAEKCCAFLCSCLGDICADSARAKPGLADCMTWCPKLDDKARRCHVYHCYISVSPTGGIRDHDSHCAHAADQLPGGGCPTVVYQ
jgi:hypothetical protein